MLVSMKQVFLSYKSTPKERAMADKLRRALEDEGIQVWVDKEAIQAGESWERVLQDQLEKIAAVVFLIGPDGKVSEAQRDEATAIFRAEWENPEKIPLIPVTTGETDLPPFLKQVAAIEVSDIDKGWSEAAKQIKQSLSGAQAAIDAPSSGENEQKARLLEIEQFANSLKSDFYSKEKLAR